MIDKTEFENIKNELAKRDVQRENMIKDSRDVLKLSKLVIYSVHRGEIDKAKELVDKMNTSVSKLNEIIKESCELKYIGSYKVAIQEYVEAIVFYSFVTEEKILTCAELGIECEHYLLGLCDLSGELVRLAVNSGIKGDYKKVESVKEFLEELYGIMLEFDFRNGELRKKFDGIKWDLNKLDDLVYNIKLRGK